MWIDAACAARVLWHHDLMADEDARRCPCGSGESLDGCCGRLHRGLRQAATATELMRSRYSAYVLGETGYLLETWDPAGRPADLEVDEVRWLYLEIVAATGGGPFDETGTVEFRAHFRAGAGPAAPRRQVLHEVSLFRRAGGNWRYVGPTR